MAQRAWEVSSYWIENIIRDLFLNDYKDSFTSTWQIQLNDYNVITIVGDCF